MTRPDADAIAGVVLQKFDSLPAKRKPRDRGGEAREWVPLAGLVLHREGWPLICASLGTGMRCLPESKIPHIAGNTLHDWHAEIVAIRAFNRWLLDCCKSLSLVVGRDASSSDDPALNATIWLRLRSAEECSGANQQPYAIRDEVELFMYCSEAPCGDASMELVMAAQEDATPWETTPAPHPITLIPPQDTGSHQLRGRGFFSHLGIVRRKPSRPDAPPTLSKSCSDKLAQKQYLSLLSSPTSLVLHPGNAYLKSLVIPSSQLIPDAMERAFGASGRLASLVNHSVPEWEGGYKPVWFLVEGTKLEFEWSRRSIVSPKLIPSNITTVFTPHQQETLIGGVLQGRKPQDPRGASNISRKKMLLATLDVVCAAGMISIEKELRGIQYHALKSSQLLVARNHVKNEARKVMAPEGWIRNDQDESWSLEDKRQD